MKTHVDRNDYDESHKIIKSSGSFLQSHYEQMLAWLRSYRHHHHHHISRQSKHIEYQVAQSQCSIFFFSFLYWSDHIEREQCVDIWLLEKLKINEIGFSGQVNQYERLQVSEWIGVSVCVILSSFGCSFFLLSLSRCLFCIFSCYDSCLERDTKDVRSWNWIRDFAYIDINKINRMKRLRRIW